MSDLMYDDQQFFEVTPGETKWRKYAVHSDTEIKGFFGYFRFLSNFYHAKVSYEGVVYPSVEAAFQGAKYKLEDRKFFETCSGYDAKKRTKTVPPDLYTKKEWDSIKAGIMRYLVFQKFNPEKHPVLHTMLMEEVAGKYVEETNWWNDTFWGVCDGKGENILGKIIMEVCEYHKSGIGDL